MVGVVVYLSWQIQQYVNCKEEFLRGLRFYFQIVMMNDFLFQKLSKNCYSKLIIKTCCNCNVGNFLLEFYEWQNVKQIDLLVITT